MLGNNNMSGNILGGVGYFSTHMMERQQTLSDAQWLAAHNHSGNIKTPGLHLHIPVSPIRTRFLFSPRHRGKDKEETTPPSSRHHTPAVPQTSPWK
jgi:hypothetical protein